VNVEGDRGRRGGCASEGRTRSDFGHASSKVAAGGSFDLDRRRQTRLRCSGIGRARLCALALTPRG